MSCQIKKTNGRIEEVLASNGKPSLLWSSLKNLPFLNDEQRENIYVNAQDVKNAVTDKNGEPILMVERVDEVYSSLGNGRIMSTDFNDSIKLNKENSYSFGFVIGNVKDLMSDKTTKVKQIVDVYAKSVKEKGNIRTEIGGIEHYVATKIQEVFTVTPTESKTAAGFILDNIKKGKLEIQNINYKDENNKRQKRETEDGIQYISETNSDYGTSESNLQQEENKDNSIGNSISAVWTETKNLQFTTTTRIKNAEDVAKTMSLLENKTVEHAFAVHIDSEGNSNIQFLSIGGITGTVVDLRLVTAGVAKFNSKRVILVHNHPSGNMKPSQADIKLTQKLREGLSPLKIEVEHVIMNTYKKQYVHIKNNDTITVNDRGENEFTETISPVEFSEFKIEKQILGKVTSAFSVFSVIQNIRFSALPKLGMFVLDNSNNIIGNYIIDTDNIYNDVIKYVGSTGVGTSVIFYSNTNPNVGIINALSDYLKMLDISVLDYITTPSTNNTVKGFYKSMQNEGLLNEHQVTYLTGKNQVLGSILQDNTEEEDVTIQDLGVVNGKRTIATILGDKKIGSITFIENETNYVADTLGVYEEYRGNNLGYEMYKYALETLEKPILSDRYRTPAAERILMRLEADGYVTKTADNRYIQFQVNDTPTTTIPSTNTELFQEVASRLEKTGLAKSVTLMTSKEIEDRLKELGYSDEVVKQVIAYHGSPHSFDKFTTEKMGTGEGAQAFGWGLYFTDLESIARNYAKKLSKQTEDKLIIEIDGVEYSNSKKNSGFKDQKFLPIITNLLTKEQLNSVTDSKSGRINYGDLSKNDWIKIGEKALNEDFFHAQEFLEGIKNDRIKIKTPKKTRNLYKVSLHKGKTPSEYTWLEWDKELSENNKEKINKQYEKESLPKTVSSSSNETMRLLGTYTNFKTYRPNTVYSKGEKFYEDLVRYFLDMGLNSPHKEASLFLLRAGIDGIKYPAESIARGATSDTARGFNYVVFDENAITVEERIQFQKDNTTVRTTTQGLIINDEEIIINSEGINPTSTLLHEYSHPYLKKLKEARPELYQRGLELAKTGEAQEIIDFVKQNQPNLVEGSEEFNNEVLAEITGRRAFELLSSKKSIADFTYQEIVTLINSNNGEELSPYKIEIIADKLRQENDRYTEEQWRLVDEGKQKVSEVLPKLNTKLKEISELKSKIPNFGGLKGDLNASEAYHFTDYDSLLSILSDNTLEGYGEVSGVSVTTYEGFGSSVKSFGQQNKPTTFADGGVRIDLDLNKIKESKLRVREGSEDIGTFVGEYELKIGRDTGIENITNYITNINVDPNVLSKEEINKINEVASSLGLNVSYKTVEQIRSRSKIKDWLNDFYNWIRDLLGLSQYTNEQVATMSLSDFAKAIGIDLMRGEELFQNRQTRDEYRVGYRADTEKVARERFDISNLEQIGKGSDRTVFKLQDGKVLKVAHSARGLAQNYNEGDYYLSELVPQVFERGLNYVVVEDTPRIENKDKVTTYDVDGNEIGETTAGVMINDLKRFTQRDFDNRNPKLQEVIYKYGFQDIFSYEVLYGDFSAKRNWGYIDGRPVHLDGGTFGGVQMINEYKGVKNLEDVEFRDIYNKSREVKRKFGDRDNYTMFQKQLEEYFTRNADRLPLTLAIFNRPEFVALQGKQVNPITVLNSLNQSGIKQIEKDLIKGIIDNNYKGQKKISYDELEATVRANIMPLERIFTSSYADYGMDNLGDGKYGDANTIILNSPIEHGVTGHFSGDFKASGRKNIKYVPKQLNDNTWVAVEEGYESQANNNNIYQFVGTAGTKESVDAWIENYENPTGIVGVYNKLLVQNVPINKGMFGHIRVWQDGQNFYVAELQSDYFQKNNARKNILDVKLSEEDYKKLNESRKKSNIKLFKELGYVLTEDIDQFTISYEGMILKQITPSAFPSKINAEDFFEDYLRGVPSIILDINNLPVGFTFNKDTQRKGVNYVVYQLKNDKGTVLAEGRDRQEAVDNYQKQESQKIKSVLEKTDEAFNKERNKLIQKLEEEKYKTLTPQEKQFIASQKVWEQRMVREAIKEAALSGATSLRFPTPYTLSVIEGYLQTGDNQDTKKLPYSIITKDLREGSEYLDINGNIVRLDTEDIIAMDSQGEYSSFIVVETINDSIKVRGIDNYRSTQSDSKKFKEIYGEDLKVGFNRVGDVDYYWKGVEDGFTHMINFLTENTQTLEQPTFYIENGFKRQNDFKITDLSDTQQTVARKYEEIANILKQERGEENVEIITDENGFDWYETKIEENENQNPVVAFQQDTNFNISIQQAIERNNGNPLNLAPNGNPSILYQSYKDLGYTDSEAERLVSQVFSDNFISWFGDWVNEPELASKVVDSEGMPLVVYHGSKTYFTVFDKNRIGSNTGMFDRLFYFSGKKETSMSPLYVEYENNTKEYNDFKERVKKEVDKTIEYIANKVGKSKKEVFFTLSDSSLLDGEMSYMENVNLYINILEDTTNTIGGKDILNDRTRAHNILGALRLFKSEKLVEDLIGITYEDLYKTEAYIKYNTINPITSWMEEDIFLISEYFPKNFKDTFEELYSLSKNIPLKKESSVQSYFLSIKNIFKSEEDFFQEDFNLNIMNSRGFDGGIIEDTTDGGLEKTTVYTVPEPNQIKSATENIGTFSPYNDDIRFQIAPNIDAMIDDMISNGDITMNCKL